MKEILALFSTGKLDSDIVVYSIIGFLVFINIYMVRYNGDTQHTKSRL